MKTEFEFIQNIKKKYSLSLVGDDCAVLPKDEQHDMIVTADMLVEDIDFRLGWFDPISIGHKVLAVSLSDIAAMGGTPKWAMLSVAVPESLWAGDFMDDFYRGWHELAAKYSVELVGGDVSRSPDKLVIDSMVGGEVKKGKAILRSGARPGDCIFVSGELGGASLGLELLSPVYYELRSVPETMFNLQMRQARPKPRVEVGMALAKINAVTAMMDISDGLSSDIAHICEASNVGALIDLEKIPIDKNLFAHLHGENEKAIDLALNGGEDFELLFTIPKEKIFLLENLPVTRIGEITSNPGKIELKRNNETIELIPKGYTHF